MKFSIATPALALVAALSLGACAPDAGVAPETAQEEQTSQLGTQNVQGAAQATFGNLIAALNNIAVQIDALNNIDIQNVDITVVDIDNLNLTVQQVDVLNNFLNNNQVEILELQNVLNNNTFLNNFLNNANILITDVVAIDVLSGGDLVIFTR